MLDNARGGKIHELTFPGGTGARSAGVATPRAPSPDLEMGLHKES
jgi:hypothetical protein